MDRSDLAGEEGRGLDELGGLACQELEFLDRRLEDLGGGIRARADTCLC